MYNCIIECASCKEREVYFIMNKLKTIKKADNNIDTTNVDMIGEVKEIFKLAAPAFDFRKDDDWKMTGKERLERGVGAELAIDIGKSYGDHFETWLSSHAANPIIIVRDTHIIIKNRIETLLLIDWEYTKVKALKTVADNDRCIYYSITLSSCGRDYHIRLIIYKTLIPYYTIV